MGGDAREGKGYMGMSVYENVKVVEETSGYTRGGARFQEKRKRTRECPAMIEVRCIEEKPHRMK